MRPFALESNKSWRSVFAIRFCSSSKPHFDVTSSGANEASMTKMKVPIVISALENPNYQSGHLTNWESILEFGRKFRFVLSRNENEAEMEDEEKQAHLKNLTFFVQYFTSDGHAWSFPAAMALSEKRCNWKKFRAY
ncbi:hypothetical protein PRIPAC_89269, partial [Pristionchus pacificus]|uniref:Uncharacterized protein n=1 Tax=Pristionchus pacificus TaxID=54126 RepID=A0A2A6CTM7_PRIPA